LSLAAAPHDERHPELDGEADRHGEDPHVLGPRDVTHLAQRQPVDLAPHHRVGGHLDGVDTQPLEVLEVAAAEVGQLARGSRDAQRLEAELQHPDGLERAVLAAADGDDAVVARPVLVAVARQDRLELQASGVPVDRHPVLEVAARAADALVVEQDVWLGLRHDATPAVADQRGSSVRPTLTRTHRLLGRLREGESISVGGAPAVRSG
jgi:hypothetical protein